jgi:5-methylcytosine-specific restriction endonuclease McrBC GTP-binding regulatory subunit McrB
MNSGGLFVSGIIIDAAYDKYGYAYIPQNLYIIGTVNI